MLSVFAPGKCRTINLFAEIFYIFNNRVFYIFNNRVSNENIYFFCTAANSFRRWNLESYLFLFCVSDFSLLLQETNFSFGALTSGTSFKDLSSDRQSNPLNVLIGALFELFLTWLIFIGCMGFLNSVSDFFDCETLTELSSYETFVI